MSAFPMDSSHCVTTPSRSTPRPVAGEYKLPGGFGAGIAENEGGPRGTPGRARAEGEVTLFRGEGGGVPSAMTIEWDAAGIEGAASTFSTLDDGTAFSNAGFKDAILW